MSNQHRCLLLSTVLFAFSISATARADVILFDDPVGDTFGSLSIQHDIVATEVTRTDTGTTFEVFFDPSQSISPPSDFSADGVFGYIDLDLDQDDATGENSNVTSLGDPATTSGLGIEYYVDLFAEEFLPGEVELVETMGFTTVATLPIAFGAHSFSVTIPHTDLGGNPGLFSFGVLVGTLDESTDQLVGVVPEPDSWLLWCCLALVSVIGTGWRRRLASSRRSA